MRVDLTPVLLSCFPIFKAERARIIEARRKATQPAAPDMPEVPIGAPNRKTPYLDASCRVLGHNVNNPHPFPPPLSSQPTAQYVREDPDADPGHFAYDYYVAYLDKEAEPAELEVAVEDWADDFAPEETEKEEFDPADEDSNDGEMQGNDVLVLLVLNWPTLLPSSPISQRTITPMIIRRLTPTWNLARLMMMRMVRFELHLGIRQLIPFYPTDLYPETSRRRRRKSSNDEEDVVYNDSPNEEDDNIVRAYAMAGLRGMGFGSIHPSHDDDDHGNGRGMAQLREQYRRSLHADAFGSDDENGEGRGYHDDDDD